jgi:hypothetical protein
LGNIIGKIGLENMMSVSGGKGKGRTNMGCIVCVTQHHYSSLLSLLSLSLSLSPPPPVTNTPFSFPSSFPSSGHLCFERKRVQGGKEGKKEGRMEGKGREGKGRILTKEGRNIKEGRI